MWKTVFGLEWKILKRDRSVLAILILFTVFLVLSSVAGGRHASEMAAGLERSKTSNAQHFSALVSTLKSLEGSQKPLSSKDPRDANWMGKVGAARLLVLPSGPLAAVAVGQRDLKPQAIRVNTDFHLSAERETETPISGPTRLMTGAFDPAFLFVVLFPLVVIALSYELLSGERERGTLAMLLSQPVSQTMLVMGKATARALALCFLTTIFTVVGLVIVDVDMSSSRSLTLMVLLVVVLIAWALFWFAASIAVNALGRDSSTNALLLVGIWLVLVVIVPGLVQVGTDSLYPAPSGIEMVHEAREAAQEAEEKLMGLTGRHDAKRQSKAYAKKLVAIQEKLAKTSAPVMEAAHQQLRERQDLVSTLRFLSPAMVLQSALESIAGSGRDRYRRFDDQADAYHAAYRTYFFNRIRSGESFRLSDVAKMPAFSFDDVPTAQIVQHVFWAILCLLGFGFLLLMSAWPRYKNIGRLSN